MPVFSYQGYSNSGLAEEGTIDAANEKIAFETLASRGITVFELQQGSSKIASSIPWYRRDIKLFGDRLELREQANTAQLMATLVSAELTSAEMVRLLAISAESQAIRLQFERIGQRLENGELLADAFSAENRLFSPIFASFLRVSDATNTLPKLLAELSEFLRKQAEIQQKIVSALIYPSILLFAAVSLLFVVVLYLAPNLEPIFVSVGKPPPGILAAMLATETFLRSNWILLSCGLAGVFVGLAYMFQHPSGSDLATRVYFRLPVIGQVAQIAELSRITQATGLLLRSGQPLADAMKNAAQAMATFKHFRILFEEAASEIEAGSTAWSIFAGENLIPPSYTELFRIGEETNRLPSTLSALSDALASQSERTTQRLLSLLTPALTLVLGLGVGLLIYTLMGAILEVNELAF